MANVLITRDTTHSQETYDPRRWCVDSGANRHLCRDVSLAQGRAKEKDLVIGEAGLGHSFRSEAEGPIPVELKGRRSKLLHHTVFASKIYENILSVGEAADQGYVMVFDKNGVTMYESVKIKGDVLLQGKRSRKNNLFYFQLETAPQAMVLAAHVHSPMELVPVLSYSKIREIQEMREITYSDTPPAVLAKLSRTYHECVKDFDLWHPRMAHINPRLALLAKPDLKDWPKKCFCPSCTQGKFHKHSHSGSRPKPAEVSWGPGEHFSCDLFGPLLKSKGGARYVAFYIDTRSRFVYAKPLREKTDNYQAMLEVIQDARARSGHPMRFMKTDGDGIFTGGDAAAIFRKYSIRHLQSAPGDSASNDIAERTIRTMAEMTTTNLLHAGAPPSFWLRQCAW